jgi:cobalt-precorrin-5B (C1)-methyltransferase
MSAVSSGVSVARSGYTLPVFAVAGAKAALLHLRSPGQDIQQVCLDLLPGSAEIPVAQVASLGSANALAITLSDPGDNLDLTSNTPIWSQVRLHERTAEAIVLEAGEGLGKTASGDPAIYRYARQLFDANLFPLMESNQAITVTITLPEGRRLAQRTSNAAFGIVDGLSLLGTSGISKPLSVEAHCDELRLVLQEKARASKHLVFCIGSHGMQVAQRLSIAEDIVVQTGNWIGALLVEAAFNQVKSVCLLGYQGKLIKLAGGIFNTSSHLADAKLEIMSAAVIRELGDANIALSILEAKTADQAHKLLVQAGYAEAIFKQLAMQISQKAQSYVQKYADTALKIETILFDRQGQLIVDQRESRIWQ